MIGGTFGEPGVIHPSSSQVGAGQAVSKEVIAQTAPQNVAYIEAERAKVGLPPPPSSAEVRLPPPPSSADQVNPYLNAFQQDLLKSSQAPEVRVPTMKELKTELAPTTPYPEPLKRVEELGKLRTEYGVADLEQSLTTIKDQIKGEQDLLREQRGIEEGKPVPMGVIAGRITEEERVANIRLDALGRQQSRIVDELNTKYNVINQIMTLQGLDYGDAVKRYETEFDINLKMYDLIAGVRREARSAFEYDQTAAKANLQIYANAAISGNIDYNSLGTDQKLMITKLEVQSGLPVGFISSIRKDPKADIIFTSTNEGVTQVGFRNADGSISVKSYGTRTPSSVTDAKNTRLQFGVAATPGAGNNFPDLVESFANRMSLEEIYQAYANSTMGIKYGNPKEDKRVIQLTYKVARGEMSEDEAREELGY